MSLAQVCKAAREKTGEKPIHAINAAKWVKAGKIRTHVVCGLTRPRFLLSEFLEDYYKKRGSPFSGESPLTLPAQEARGMIIYFTLNLNCQKSWKD